VAEKLARSQQKFTALREVSAGFLDGHPNPAIGLFMELARSPGARSVPAALHLARVRRGAGGGARARAQPERDARPPRWPEVQRRMQWRLDRVMRRWDAVGGERLAEWRAYDSW
jgi:multiple sugar transport system substrate-binding protein